MKAFLRGIGSILNLYPALTAPRMGTLEDDWKDIGQDFAKATDSAPMPLVVPSAEAVTPGAKVERESFSQCLEGLLALPAEELAARIEATNPSPHQTQPSGGEEGESSLPRRRVIWLDEAWDTAEERAELRLATMAVGGTP